MKDKNPAASQLPSGKGGALPRRRVRSLFVVAACAFALGPTLYGCRSKGDLASPPTAPTPSPPASPSASAACFGNDVQTLDLPLYWDQPSSPTFQYRFEVKSSQPGGPLVIVIPGGPGAPSIGFAALAGGSLPAGLNVVYTDPRGSNCNAAPGGHFPVDAYRTEYLARDVKALIESLRPSSYWIYAHSYGTVQATVLASILERESAYQPNALVLEGILGRHLANGFPEQIAAFDAQWQRIWATLDPGVAASFLQPTLPLGFSSRQWALYISESLYEGVVPGVGIRLQILLDQLAANDPATNSRLSDYFAGLNGGFRYLADPNVNAIGCRELYGSIFGRDLVGGHLVPIGDDACVALGVAYSDPYDSANWPTTVPIYYFEGSNDPATPPAYAVYHYDAHPGSPRHFVYVQGASHDPLTQSLHSAGCSDAVWQNILSGTGTLRGALAGCSLEIHLTEVPPQQAAAWGSGGGRS
jgi:pimeloyl-ACP methyl ester carboxylesterase